MSSNILIGNKAIDEGKKKGAIDGKNSVILNPAAYNLYTQEQMDAIGSYESGKSKGISEITSDPATYNLYTKAQYESHSIPHEINVNAGWNNTRTWDRTPGMKQGTTSDAHSYIYVDNVLFHSYSQKDTAGTPYLRDFTVGG